jgi:hypothetical protein
MVVYTRMNMAPRLMATMRIVVKIEAKIIFMTKDGSQESREQE